jgi:NADH:quinone reductase (non-electrogenic)
MKRVAVVGMGFGGLSAARTLAGQGVELILVDRQNFHLFTPLLYQVATGSQELESIVYPLRDIIRDWRQTRFRLAEVHGVDLGQKVLHTSQGSLPYDYLILSPGSVPNFLGIDSVKAHAFVLKDLADGVRLRNHVLRAFELALEAREPDERRGLLTFVIVGGGPTGVEFAGALAELVRLELRRDYAELGRDEVQVVLVEASDSLLGAYPRALGAYAAARLESMGVAVRLQTRVVGAEPDRVLLAEGQAILTHTLIWSTGVRAESLARDLPEIVMRGGRVEVAADLSLPGHPEVFLIGDSAYVEQDGRPLPQMAPVAVQQGQHAARAILAAEAGRAREPFHYRDRGMMAVVGRGKAVASLFGWKFRGFLAWLVWLGFHLIALIGFRNRIVVMVNWIDDYLFFGRKLRLITEASRPEVSSDPDPEQEMAGARPEPAPLEN